jgi:hypothetical protein
MLDSLLPDATISRQAIGGRYKRKSPSPGCRMMSRHTLASCHRDRAARQNRADP